MARPGTVVEVDGRTPPMLLHFGEGFRLEKLPRGSRIVYPPDPLPSLRHPDAEIRRALLEPQGSDPLPALLRPGMKLTVAFDDISLPLPPMKTPDVRQRVIEQVLEMAAAAGVDDVELVAATSLHRRMTTAEIKRMVGERVFRAFWPHGLRNHDAEDPAGMAFIGTTDEGEEVEISRRAAESDLLVYVNINLVAMDGGHKSVPVGLGSYRSIRHHHNVRTMLDSHSFMDPGHSGLHGSCARMGRLLADHLKVFTVESTLNNRTFPDEFGFLMKREREWSLADQLSFVASKNALERLPAQAKRQIFQRIVAPHQMTGVHAGETEAVHERTLANLHRQQLVEVPGQADVLVAGLPYICPYNVNSIMNPILVACLGLGYFFNMYVGGKPLVRRGGAMIMFHPTPYEFHPGHHPSYIDFFEEVLAETTDPLELEAKFEEDYATDPWYVHLYRTGYAYHGVHPFYMWYWCAHALEHLGDVIVVGGDPRAVRRMGFRPASSLRDELEIAEQTVGRDPSLTYLHVPPLALSKVV